jgi:hypothetical protein
MVIVYVTAEDFHKEDKHYQKCLFVCLMVNGHYDDVLLPLPLHGVGA